MSRELTAFTRNVGHETGSIADSFFNTVCKRTTAFSSLQETLPSDLPSPLLSNSQEEALLRDIRYEHFQSTCTSQVPKKTLKETTSSLTVLKELCHHLHIFKLDIVRLTFSSLQFQYGRNLRAVWRVSALVLVAIESIKVENTKKKIWGREHKRIYLTNTIHETWIESKLAAG